MGTNFIRVDNLVGEVGTSRVMVVTTAAAQRLLLLTSATILVNIQNLGPANVCQGSSSMAMGSGDTIFPFANREFYPVGDAFEVYLRANSAATNVVITEFYPA